MERLLLVQELANNLKSADLIPYLVSKCAGLCHHGQEVVHHDAEFRCSHNVSLVPIIVVLAEDSKPTLHDAKQLFNILPDCLLALTA